MPHFVVKGLDLVVLRLLLLFCLLEIQFEILDVFLQILIGGFHLVQTCRQLFGTAFRFQQLIFQILDQIRHLSALVDEHHHLLFQVGERVVAAAQLGGEVLVLLGEIGVLLLERLLLSLNLLQFFFGLLELFRLLLQVVLGASLGQKRLDACVQLPPLPIAHAPLSDVSLDDAQGGPDKLQQARAELPVCKYRS